MSGKFCFRHGPGYPAAQPGIIVALPITLNINESLHMLMNCWQYYWIVNNCAKVPASKCS